MNNLLKCTYYIRLFITLLFKFDPWAKLKKVLHRINICLYVVILVRIIGLGLIYFYYTVTHYLILTLVVNIF